MTNILILNKGDKPKLNLVARAGLVLRRSEGGFFVEKSRNSRLPLTNFVKESELAGFLSEITRPFSIKDKKFGSIEFPQEKICP